MSAVKYLFIIRIKKLKKAAKTGKCIQPARANDSENILNASNYSRLNEPQGIVEIKLLKLYAFSGERLE